MRAAPIQQSDDLGVPRHFQSFCLKPNWSLTGLRRSAISPTSIVAPCLSLFSPLFAMRRPGVRIPSRPPDFKTTSSVPNSSYRGTLGLSSLSDSFRYLVIHPERHAAPANYERCSAEISPRVR